MTPDALADTSFHAATERRPKRPVIDRTRDALLTAFGKATLTDRYLMPGEGFQDLFARVAEYYADDAGHAQRLYDYASRFWFLPATPILSNGGTTRGLPISCFLNEASDSLEGIVNLWDENVWLASKGGGIGCVDADTEFLTRKGWKRIADWENADEVMAVDKSGDRGHFEQPQHYISAPADGMVRFTGTFSDMVVSNNHRNFVRFDGKGAFGDKTTSYLLEEGRFAKARFKPAIASDGGAGLPYTDLELRFLVALAADGCNVTGRPDVKFGLKRHRKIERLRWMLAELEIPYQESTSDHSTCFYLADSGVEKRPLDFANFGEATGHQIKVIFNELGFWDGSFDQKSSHLRFSTFKKEEADFAQYVIMSATGMRSGIGAKTRDNEWCVRETGDHSMMVRDFEPFNPVDGKQYCFQTSTTFWLARRNGSVFVTGNTYWGNIRSIGEPCGENGKTSGVIPFIRVMDSQTLAISQGSLRRGSAAIYLPISHPEIEEVVEIRRPTGGDPNRKALNLHHGILIPDAFMRAVEQGAPWELRSPKTHHVIRTIDARSLWVRILTARIETGEPYLVFEDAANAARPQHHKDAGLRIKTSNLCSEILLPTGLDHRNRHRTAVCCLSSLNVEHFQSWKDNPDFIPDVMRFLDNVLQDFIDNAPDTMNRAKYAAMRERSVGLGVMGFHSLLQRQMIPFESDEAAALNIRIFSHIRAQADTASRLLADERGPCPDALEFGAHERFSYKMAIAPTASISIIAGTTSPGIDPISANVFMQKTLSGSFVVRNEYLRSVLAVHGRDDTDTWNSITSSEGSVQHLGFLTDLERSVFRTAFELDQRWVVEHAAGRTPFICQGQSLNLFLRANIQKRDLHEIHFMAWKRGVKSLYYCRSLSIQRADTVTVTKIAAPTPTVEVSAEPYQECLSCQ